MRIIFLFILVVGGFSRIGAQGTLQFNKVVLLESSQQSCAQCWTVPANKVWKIQAVAGGPNSGYPQMVINNKTLSYLANNSNNSANILYPVQIFPLWLPAGATFGFTGMCSGCNIAFTGIEFNVIP
ncbi:MAG: hypothetical protein O3C46_00775 [Bacteroidetes bacterium]|jgi:hypothetical protein|nr:hypothetical protein [Bacteroidota bacterium]MDA0930175.1 hypothetical protein [Bacteroidota bacterium]